MPPPSDPPSPPAHGQADRSLARSARLLDKLQHALRRHQRADIIAIVAELIACRAPLGRQWHQISRIAADHGEVSLARQAIELFVEAAGGSARAQYQKFDLLSRTGAMEEAGVLLDALPESVPDPATNAYSQGATALFLGELDKARGKLDLLTSAWPETGEGWLPLATLVDFADEPELADRIIAAEGKVRNTPPAMQSTYYYALGKMHADLGDHTRAFDAYARGAAIKKGLVQYDRERDRTLADEATRGYTAERIADIARRQDKPTGRSIFVTGSPRSGTTLVEQIITSHSAMSDGAEINLLRLLWQDLRALDHATLSGHVAERGTAWAADLWQHLLDERFPDPGRVIDKSTDAGYFLGLVGALLPDAPIIWMTRDPLDCAWSCFSTHFLTGLEWTYDLEDIGFHFRQTDKLRAHWQDVLGDRLLVVPYEQLVVAPDDWSRRILAHCGLDEEPQVFAPHETRRAVVTSSVMQVRRPISTRRVGAAEPYREWLDPFIRAYEG